MKHAALKEVSSCAMPLTDIPTLRRPARQHIAARALTSDDAVDRGTVVHMLNCALATELACALRYKRHHLTAAGSHAVPMVAAFLHHAHEELAHADRLARRIMQLRGEPNFSPDGLTARSQAAYVGGATLGDMIKENLMAERAAIASYRAMVAYLGDRDPTTRRMIEEILAMEEAHAEDLSSVMDGF